MLQKGIKENIIGVSVGIISTFIGGWDTALQILLILMFMDILSGCIKSLYLHRFKSKSLRKGLLSKAGFFLVIILAYQIDLMIGNTEPVVRTVTIIYYISVEGTSLLENLGQMGVPIPTIISKYLSELNSESNSEVLDSNKKN